MTIADDPRIQKIAPWITAEVYRRDGGYVNPRHRIELMNTTPRAVRIEALGIVGPCAHCGREIHYFRQRRGGRSIYVAVACPLEVRMGCSRGEPAAEEVKALIALVQGQQPPSSQARMLP